MGSHRMFVHKLVAVVTLLVLWPAWHREGRIACQEVRPFVTDDLFRLEEVGEPTFSPDGKWLAYVVKRPGASHQGPNFLQGNDRADVWLVSTAGGEPMNITKGATQGAGYWSPIWSPDSERIALLSTLGGNIRVWVWERRSGALKRVSDRGINPIPWGGTFTWVSNEGLVFPVLPENKKSFFIGGGTKSAVIAMTQWPKAWEGKETTANVLDSGVPSHYETRAKGALVFANVETGALRIIAPGDFTDLSFSPDKRHIAMLEQVDVTNPKGDRSIDLLEGLYQLAVFSVDGSRSRIGRTEANFIRASIRWAPDGSKLALMGVASDGSSQPYLFAIEENSLRALSAEKLLGSGSKFMPGSFIWSDANGLVLRASQSNRTDWWIVNPTGQTVNLTKSFDTVPGRLVKERARDSFVSPVNGSLWRIFVDGSAPVELIRGSRLRIKSVVWPTARQSEAFAGAIVVCNGEIGDTFALANFESKTLEPIQIPDPAASLASYDSIGQQAVFTLNTRDGTSLWLKRQNASAKLILKANAFLSGIGEGEAKRIDYRSLDGDVLSAWIIFPPNYRAGRHYPTIAWVYAGDVADETKPSIANLNSTNPLNLQILASRGYLVVLPSMPLRPMTKASDPYADLTKGVLPALDKAIEMGYADATRLGVMGQSYGGFSAYGLITQTNRFRAAVALAAPSDLISLYGTFDAQRRYDDYAHENLLQMMLFENGQQRMRNPPWRDAARYLRNSPLFWVERVETPVMIVQGDLDFVGIEQGEEFFTALYRQAKRARFVRYWGEGHVLLSPANVRDMWHRTLSWFDEFLDLSRDAQGMLLFDGDRLKPRDGAPTLRPQDFARFDQMILKESQRSSDKPR